MRLFYFLLLMFFSVSVFCQDNSQWRGPNRDGIYPATGLLNSWPEAGPDMVWHYDELGPGHGSAAIANSSIYIAGTEGEDGFVISFDFDGKIKWKKHYGKEWLDSYDGVRTTPAIIKDKLYILSAQGVLNCMDSFTGDLIWQVDVLNEYGGENLKWGITENLLIYDDIVICTPGDSRYNVIALNRFTGQLIWECAGKGEISAYNSPLLIDHNGHKVIVNHSQNHILGIDAVQGTLLWSYEQPNRWSVHANTPIYKDGKIYVVTGYGKGGVMLQLNEDASKVTEVWTDEELDNKLGGVVLIDGRIYGSGDFTRKWVCLDWDTGKELFNTKEIKKGNIIAAEGLLYWYSQSGELALVEALEDGFKIISTFKVPYGKDQHWAHSVIHDKRLYIRHGTSLMVYDIAQKKKLISEWRGPGRTGVYSDETGLLKKWPEGGPQLKWYLDSIPKGYSSVTVHNNVIFTTGIREDNDVLIATNEKGEILWETSYGRKWDSSYDLSRCTPTIEEDMIYVSSGLGDVACINAKDGEIIWSVKANEKFGGKEGKFGLAESLLLIDDIVICTPGGDVTTVVALDKYSGATIWESESLNEVPSYTSPLLVKDHGEDFIVITTTNYLFALNPQNGEMLWKFNIGEYAGGKSKRNNQTNTPLYKNGSLFYTSGYDHKSLMLKLEEDNRSVNISWVDTLLDVHHGGVVELDGYIYGANWLYNRKGNWTCLEWESGKEMYSTEWENKGSIISADGMLYCYDEKDGNIALVPVDPSKFEVVSSFKVPYGKGPHWSHPVIDQGVLYIRHGEALMAYDIKK